MSPWIALVGLALGQSPVEPVIDERAAIQASVVLKVQRQEEVAAAIIAHAQELGGYFASRSSSEVRLKIPSEHADDFLDFVSEQGLLVGRSYSSEGLIAPLTDKQARLQVRQEMLGQYFAVLEQASTASVIAVEQQIVQLVATIEGLKGAIRALEHRAAYADITVSFQFRERAAPARDGSSSFAWLNTLNLADLIDDFHNGARSSASRRTTLAPVPDGFAPYRMRRESRAVSPDDVLLRVRAERHRPRADLTFWEEAVRGRMIAAGYQEVSHQRITADGGEGMLLELTAPLGTDDYTYLLAVFLRGGKIIVVEAAGEITRFAERRAEIIAAIAAL